MVYIYFKIEITKERKDLEDALPESWLLLLGSLSLAVV